MGGKAVATCTVPSLLARLETRVLSRDKVSAPVIENKNILIIIIKFSGAVGIVWTVVWMMLTYDKPANHPRISIKEKEYIQSSIGSGQDVITRVSHSYLMQHVPVNCTNVLMLHI